MSELAFNLNGEPFELPPAAVGWRVRRIKGRGAPEVVYSRDGVPLIVPIDTDIDDLRDAVRGEGRFRLDPVDEHNRMIPQAPAGYVCVQPSESASELAPLASRTPSDNVAIEAMRMNTELARTIIDRFPMMMESAAALLRAADGAGLPAREPRSVGEPGEGSVEQSDQDEEGVEDSAPKGMMGLLEKLVPIVLPSIVSAIAGGKLKIPGGVGALFDCRKASSHAWTEAAATASHATTTPGGAPAPGPRDPAPAASSRTPSNNGRAGARTGAEATPAAAAVPSNLPTIDQADMMHFTAILNALSLRERMYAQALAAELSPDELRSWIAELKQLSVADAVTKIRAVLGIGDDTSAPGVAATGDHAMGGAS